MKFHLTRSGGRNLFTGYGDGFIKVNDQKYERNMIVAPDRAIMEWGAPSFEDLTPEHFGTLLELEPEIVIFGTGDRLKFPHPRLTCALAEAHVGLEVMDTRAACRTYNILMDEGRQVVAAILV